MSTFSFVLNSLQAVLGAGLAQWWRRSPSTNVSRVVGSVLCSERFFFGYCGFPLPSKTNISKFQFDLDVRHFSHELLARVIVQALPVLDVEFTFTLTFTLNRYIPPSIERTINRSQSPLSWIEAKSPHSPREKGIQKSKSPHLPYHKVRNLLQSPHKVPVIPRISPGSRPPLGSRWQVHQSQ